MPDPMDKQALANIRKDYRMASLEEKDAGPDPFLLFEKWFDAALRGEVEEPNAMTLATCGSNGRPSARIVLLKGFDRDGFYFYTNYESKKGKQLAENPYAALVFFWKELERQVRVEGTISKTTPAQSDEYFNIRPEGSRIGAWASPQSRVISGRETLDQNVKNIKQLSGENGLLRPPFWGGYLLRPALIEFWQGRSNRLHDRLQYTLLEEGGWKIERLAP